VVRKVGAAVRRARVKLREANAIVRRERGRSDRANKILEPRFGDKLYWAASRTAVDQLALKGQL